MQQPVWVEIVRVGVAGAVAGKHANAAARTGPLAGGLDDLLVDAQSDGGNRLEVEVGIVAARREGFTQAALQQPLGDAKLLEKIALVVGKGGTAEVVIFV